MIPVFDGHNDTLLALREHPERDFFARNDAGHIDLPRAQEGGLAGGFFAVFPPTGQSRAQMLASVVTTEDGYEVPMAQALDPATATRAAMGMTADLFRLERASGGRLAVVRTVAEIRDCLASGTLAAILHFEGAEAIGEDLDALEVFYRAGLRSLGVVWSRPNAFGHGVPMSFPRSPDTGPGLTAAGRDLVRACNALGIMIDLSHLTERGFWDVAELSDAPLVATHSNAHALSPHPRNLTDDQLRAVRESDGMVGVNFAVSFLREDGARDAATPLETMVRHVDHLIDLLGPERVGFGSDFDGALIPEAIGSAAGLQALVDALRRHGYDDATLRKLAHENWLALLGRTWR